jgi:hypothetical protein
MLRRNRDVGQLNVVHTWGHCGTTAVEGLDDFGLLLTNRPSEVADLKGFGGNDIDC